MRRHLEQILRRSPVSKLVTKGQTSDQRGTGGRGTLPRGFVPAWPDECPRREHQRIDWGSDLLSPLVGRSVADTVRPMPNPSRKPFTGPPQRSDLPPPQSGKFFHL